MKRPESTHSPPCGFYPPSGFGNLIKLQYVPSNRVIPPTWHRVPVGLNWLSISSSVKPLFNQWKDGHVQETTAYIGGLSKMSKLFFHVKARHPTYSSSELLRDKRRVVLTDLASTYPMQRILATLGFCIKCALQQQHTCICRCPGSSLCDLRSFAPPICFTLS